MPIVESHVDGTQVFFTPRQFIRLSLIKQMVDQTRQRWQAVPFILRPIAEDLSYIVPKWLEGTPPPSPESENWP